MVLKIKRRGVYLMSWPEIWSKCPKFRFFLHHWVKLLRTLWISFTLSLFKSAAPSRGPNLSALQCTSSSSQILKYWTFTWQWKLILTKMSNLLWGSKSTQGYTLCFTSYNFLRMIFCQHTVTTLIYHSYNTSQSKANIWKYFVPVILTFE